VADAELDAMAAVSTALEGLDAPVRARVLAWAAAKWDIPIGSPKSITRATVDDSEHGGDASEFADVADLVHAAQPSNGPQRALVVAYWFQEVQGREGWLGSDINSTLKNMGTGLPNVTDTLNSLKAKKPALVMQTAKSGRSQQARKTYKLTSAGVNEVRRMLTSAGAGDMEAA
jgi:hypothetical protein